MNKSETNPKMPKKCPQCGATLPTGALEGLCPACLLRQGPETGPFSESAPFQPPSVEEVARLFPQLEILAFLGKGGMGAVYQARQPALDRMVALKILPPQAAGGPDFAERFNREARALARLNHPSIVTVHEFGQAGGSPFFIMEFMDGLTLRQLEQTGRLSPTEALRIVPQICEALQFAHDEGIVHRDIKPENILIDKKGRVKIADFGIAKIIGGAEAAGSMTETRHALGTPHYMAPEQAETPQSVDHRADIYSLGVVFYEMLTGQLPLGRFAPPSRKVEIDARLDEVVLRALEREPELRYQRASEVKTQIDTITSTPPGKALPRATLTANRVFAWVSLGIFLGGLIGCAFWIALHDHSKMKAAALAEQQAASGASAETWAPPLAPGAKPDLQGIMSEAKDLMNKGRFDEALGREIWFFNHATQFDPSYSAVRVSFALGDWRELARRFPKALQALTETRDRDVAEFTAGRGSAQLLQDVDSINRELGDPESTCKLCKIIADKDPSLANQCFYYAQKVLLKQGQYELCSRFMGDAQARFKLARSNMHGDNFVQQVRTLVEILVGTGHKAEAETMAAQAIAVQDDLRLHSAVADAEANIARRGK